MAEVTIVFIPEQDDYVWKISSEKVPHMTFLFLGNISDASIVRKITEYVEHTADTSLRRFDMSVDRRGELGPDKADVLFFDDFNNNWLEDVRHQLLTDPNIRTAYDSVPQFDTWVPHLTLGFPETPAKPDKRDFPGIHWVQFDRIAVWTTESDGPEFLLKRHSDMAMSDTAKELVHRNFKTKERKALAKRGQAMPDGSFPIKTQQDLKNAIRLHGHAKDKEAAKAHIVKRAKALGLTDALPDDWKPSAKQSAIEAFVEHHGVKGMKWGVRKKRSSSTTRTKFTKPPRKLSDEQLQKRIKRMETEKKYNALNSGDKSRGRTFVEEVLSTSGKRLAKGLVFGVGVVATKRILEANLSGQLASEVAKRL